jgi:hypothetical protein
VVESVYSAVRTDSLYEQDMFRNYMVNDIKLSDIVPKRLVHRTPLYGKGNQKVLLEIL